MKGNELIWFLAVDFATTQRADFSEVSCIIGCLASSSTSTMRVETSIIQNILTDKTPSATNFANNKIATHFI